MQERKQPRIDDYTDLCCHRAIRPIIWVKDAQGNTWLCDKNVDPADDLRKKDCWRCDEMAFPAGGR
ncbi:MAG: hypothetical protein KGY61_10400 [Desulfobacterales bacterium]|nr:hypothetical protein [Desulfobacterales bacterium]